MNLIEGKKNTKMIIPNLINSKIMNKNKSCDIKNEIIRGDFKLEEKLGEGTFGKVILGTHLITGEKVRTLNKFFYLKKLFLILNN